MKTTVVHCKKEKYDIYCGRPGPYGNPFIIGKDGDREEVCKKYKDWFYNPNQSQFRKDIINLKGKILACWCHPLSCHCDIIAEYLNLEFTDYDK